MSAVGFDIGNENSVIAAAKQRRIDVLLNDESRRETPTVVSFGEKQRFLGSAGAASAAMLPKSTIYQIKRLIGRKFSDSTVQNDLRLFPFEASEGPDGGILIHLQYLNEIQSFTPIQILAMFLAHLKKVTEKNLEKRVTKCVIGIPSYFTDLQRRAYLRAAEIAGLTSLRLIHDCTATALGYGIYKTDFQRNSTTNVVFIDVGHSDTQVAVVSFSPGVMKVLSHAFDDNLGGRDFDEVLFRYFATQFREQDNIDVYASARASMRLRAACEKLKKVLSANSEAPLNIECLMEEKDVRGYIKRDDFEKLSSDLLERIKITCHKALRDSGLTVEMVHTVELVGSGSRIPAITKILNLLFRKEASRTINASECVALGCSVQCAMLSSTSREGQYEVEDCFPFSIGLQSNEILFYKLTNKASVPKSNHFPRTEMFTLHKSDIFNIEALYTNQEELPPGALTRISSFKIAPVRVSHSEKAKINIKVLLNLHGIVTIYSDSMIEHHLDGHPVVSENVDPHNQDNFGTDGIADHATQMRKVTNRHKLFIEENVHGGLMLGELSQAQQKEFQLTQQDIKMERTKDKKNTLESYVYETRNKLLNKYRSFATDSEKEGISSKLQQTEEWLYDEGDDESEYAYTRVLEDLKKMVNPIENRYNDEEARALASRGLSNCIVECREAIYSLPSGERDAEKDAVWEECCKARQWLREKTQQQALLPKSADPILWSSHITEKTEALAEMCKQLIPPRPSFSNQEDVKGFQLTQQDIKMERTKVKKNTLESYVYETRNKLLNKYRSFATDSEKEGISSKLQQTEEWLHDEGDDESEYAYTRVLEDLKKMVNPIENRYNDEEARALASRGLSNCIVECREAIYSLPSGERDAEKNAVWEECCKARQWLREKTQQQASLPKSADPILWSSHITEKTEDLAEMCKQLIAPRPSFSNQEDVKESETRGQRDDDMDVV